MNVPMSIRKALAIYGESKTVHYLLHSEYELNNTSWSKLQHKYNVSHNTVYTVHTEKRRPGGSQYQQKENGQQRKELQLQCPLIILLIINQSLFYF